MQQWFQTRIPYGNYLLSKYPELVINPDDPDSLIQATDDVEQDIEVLELIGCALIIHGNAATREQGRQCWKKALELRKINICKYWKYVCKCRQRYFKIIEFLV